MSKQLKQRVELMLSAVDPEQFMDGEDARFSYVKVNDAYKNCFDMQYAEWESIKAEVLDHYGGEGQGDQYWTVWKFTEGGESVLVKFDGWYQSYNGAEFTDWSFVEPKQKTVTVYE